MLKNSVFGLRRTELSLTEFADLVRSRMTGLGAEIMDEEVLRLCRDTVLRHPMAALCSFDYLSLFIHRVFCTLRCELEILQDFADDPNVTEIMVNGPYSVFIESCGVIKKADISFETKEQLEHVIRRIAAAVGREINDLNPIVDARLSDGSRVNAVNSNIAINGPILTIRKFSKSRLTMEELVEQGALSRDASLFVISLVEAGYNIFVSGGTSSGKTTFLNILSDYIPKDERLIVIEDSAELQIRGHENLVRLEARQANAQGTGLITIKDLIKSSLRMRPDRIIVGEVRGGEAVDMISAMSTGHDGSLSTGHANSPAGMIRRLESMFLSESSFPLKAVQSQIAEGIEIIIHLERDEGGVRRIKEISEFLGYENGEPVMNRLYIYDVEKGLCKTENKLKRDEKLRRSRKKD